MADAIVQAQRRVKIEEKMLEEKAQEERRKQWHKILHYKEYSPSKCIIVNCIHKARNIIVVLLVVLFIKKKDAISDAATKSLLRSTIDLILELTKWFLYILAIGFSVVSFYSIEERTFVPFNFILLMYAFLIFILARFLRLVQFEVDKITDREYILGILSAITSLIAMVVAIVALFKA